MFKLVLAVGAQEKPTGKVADAWAAALEARGMQAVDIASGIAEALAVKDAAEIMHIKKAALLAAKTAKVSLTPKIEGEPAAATRSAGNRRLRGGLIWTGLGPNRW